MQNLKDETLFALIKEHLNRTYRERDDTVIHLGSGHYQPADWYRDFARAVTEVALKQLIRDSRRKLKAQTKALIAARKAINSMKVEAETAAQGDAQMMLDACEHISNEGLDASTAIDAAIAAAKENT